MAESISGHVAGCLALFRRLVDPEDGLEFPDREILFQMIDEQSRFKVWVGNSRAYGTGMSSLDYRLRDSSHIKSHVIKLVQRMASLIEDASAIIRGELIPWDQLNRDEDDPDNDNPDIELGQIAFHMAHVVNCLLSLSMALRDPVPHDRYVGAKSTNMSHFEPFDVQHVSSKYKNIEPWLADRLGKAISRRRQYLRYQQTRYEKTSHRLNEIELGTGETLVDESIASPIPSYLGTGGLPIITDDGSITGISQTSYTTSISNAGRPAIPPVPEEAYKGPFQCPLCYMIIVVKDKTTWK